MELRHLRYFIVVAQEENVSRAARKLHISQPALSRQIRDLEDELGFLLLERRAKSVRLTPAGRTFLPEARSVLERAEKAVTAARLVATDGVGELNVGYAPSLTARILPPALRALQTDLPRVRVFLHDLSTEEMLEGLSGGKLQIALLVRPSTAALRGLRFEGLTREVMRLAVAPNHPLARQPTVTLADAVIQPLISYSRKDYPEYQTYLARVFAGTGRKPRIVAEHDSASSLVAAVEAGCGTAIVPESLACMTGRRLKLLALSPAPAPLVIGAAWIKDGLTAAGERFLRHLKEFEN